MPPKKLFHGTSRPRLQTILDLGNAKGLYLADVEDKSMDYAEQRARQDAAELAMLVVDSTRLPGSLEVDAGSSEAEWEEDMGQWIYTGKIPPKAIRAAYYIDEDTDEHRNMKPKRGLGGLRRLKNRLMPP
jgi:hypothetical protein